MGLLLGVQQSGEFGPDLLPPRPHTGEGSTQACVGAQARTPLPWPKAVTSLPSCQEERENARRTQGCHQPLASPIRGHSLEDLPVCLLQPNATPTALSLLKGILEQHISSFGEKIVARDLRQQQGGPCTLRAGKTVLPLDISLAFSV